jgi:hypothetical protein
MGKCGRCGGETMSGGALYSPVRSSFRPQDSKFMTLQTGDVMTKATMCRQCGLIELTGDVSKLRRLTGDLSPLPPLEATRGQAG